MNEKYAILFPGQGSQYEDMGKDIINSNLYGSNIYKKLNTLVSKETAEIIINAQKEDISKTRYAQLAIFLNSVLLFEEVKKLDIDIVASAGLSLGEYSAICASEMIDIEEAIKLVDIRGQIMADGVAGKGSMIAVMRSDIDTIDAIIADIKKNTNNTDILLEICNLNSPAQIVVGGDFDALDIFEQKCKESGIKRTIRLDVEGPFHTSILKSSANVFGKTLNQLTFSKPKFDVYSNVDAISYKNEGITNNTVVEKLKTQMFSTVRFEDCIRKIINQGCNNFIEIGPGKALSAFVNKIDKNCTVHNVQTLQDLEELKMTLKK
ncbi:MAG: ACP S-malonyltransferase [Eubacteriales bacterium]|nr:ACP S-malonyltransferase [Eubacteriales bacterium]MDY3332420.1 ACP S-malonyltransferase [Gallibacter sp.]